MALASPVCEYVDESESTDKQGVCKTKRVGCAEQGLDLHPRGCETSRPVRQARPLADQHESNAETQGARVRLARHIADVLAGLVSAEEALDLPRIEPEDAATNSLEANQPLSLKDKLKAKVEAIEAQQGATADPTAGAKAAEDIPITQRDHTDDDPAEPYRVKLRVCERTSQAITHTFNTIPEEIRQDCFSEYQTQLKALSKKK